MIIEAKTCVELKQQLDSEVGKFAARVQPVYKLLNWGWRGKGPPTEFDIGRNVLALFDTALGNLDKEGTRYSEVCTGGLSVTVEYDFEEDLYIAEIYMQVGGPL